MEKKKPKLHIMLDTETLGREKGSVMLSVAWKAFLLGDSVDNKECGQYTISVLSSVIHHLTTDFDTAEWWQADERREALDRLLEEQRDAVPLDKAMKDLYHRLTSLSEVYTIYLWGRGVGSFDLPILSECMHRAVGETYRQPWEFWQAVDVRSIVRFCRWSGMEQEQEATPHSAMQDVEKQIREIQGCWNYIALLTTNNSDRA